MAEEKDFAERVIALGFDEPTDTSFFIQSDEEFADNRNSDLVDALDEYFSALIDKAEQLDLGVATYVQGVKFSCKAAVYKLLDDLLKELESLGAAVDYPVFGGDTLRFKYFEFPKFP